MSRIIEMLLDRGDEGNDWSLFRVLILFALIVTFIAMSFYLTAG